MRKPELEVENGDLLILARNETWAVLEYELFEFEGIKGFAQGGLNALRGRTELPTNFFSTEMMQVDVNNELDVLAFINEYGVPYSPRSTFFLVHSEAYKEWEYIFALSERLNNAARQPESYGGLGNAVSYSEIARVLTTFQTFWFQWEHVLSGESGGIDYHLITFLKSASSSQITLATNFGDGQFGVPGENVLSNPRFGLTQAIANQIITTMHKDISWYQCKAPDCKRWFKEKRSTDAPRSTSEYCSDTCANRYRKQKKDAKKKAQRSQLNA